MIQQKPETLTSEEKLAYFASTTDRPQRDDLVSAAEMVSTTMVDGEKVAVDCGCGAGSDVAYLRGLGFRVHAFDVEPEAIRQCKQRFSADSKVHLSVSSFSDFDYPTSSLVVADASLFFCPPADFEDVWLRLSQSITPGGVFCGSFLGPEDTMASDQFERDVFWPDVTVVSEDLLREKFRGFDILNWTEHRQSGKTAQGVPHDWHIFAVVARKLP